MPRFRRISFAAIALIASTAVAPSGAGAAGLIGSVRLNPSVGHLNPSIDRFAATATVDHTLTANGVTRHPPNPCVTAPTQECKLVGHPPRRGRGLVNAAVVIPPGPTQ
jgi:hypothetical protein